MDEILHATRAPERLDDAAPSFELSPPIDQSHADRGEMDTLTRAFDWASTPLGRAEHWPQSLKTIVQVLLTSRFAMWMGWGPDLTFLYNDAYGRMTLGKKHPWALGKPAHEVWAEIWRDLEPRVSKVMETGNATWDEALLLFLERSGYKEETYHTFSYSPLTDDEGSVAGMLCVVSEETERVIGERRLASLRDLASELATTTTEQGVLAAIEHAVGANQRDLPFTLTYLFQQESGGGRRARLACSTGVGPEHIDVANSPVTNWPVEALLASDENIVVDDLSSMFAALPTGAWDTPPRRATVVPIAQQGQDAPAGFLVAGINPYRQLDDAYTGFIDLIAGQIASSLANARAYAEEKQRSETLAELDRAKTQFFSNVSHEFRTPLTLLLGPAEEALSDPATVGANRARIEMIHRNALRLLKLVNTLLDFSRVEAGRVDAVYAPTDLPALTLELASTFRSAIEQAGLTLILDAPPFPGATPPVYVDRDMWEKIVLNLLSNAFKHTFEGEITVRLRPNGETVELTVSDTGIGISPEQLPRIFDRFHRVPSARSRTHEGTGIGLALVQELVRRHGGSIDVVSRESAGTTFTISVPYGAAHLPPDRVHDASGARDRNPSSLTVSPYVDEALRWTPQRPTARESRLESEPSSSLVPRILLADDNADMRDYVARLLEAEGWIVEAVTDGVAALAATRRQLPSLVLTDVMMPGLDGFELLRALRNDPDTSTLPVIMLSARAGREARVEGARGGADDYLVKPFSAQELVARVGTHLKLGSERARATAMIGAARDLLANVLEQAPVAISVFRGPNHVFELANPFYRRFVGGRELLGKPMREVVPETEAEGFVALLDDVYRTGIPYVGNNLPLTYDRHGDGQPVTAYFTFLYHPYTEADGQISGVIAVALDVTDQVEAQRDAETANLSKSQFLAGMSHELRTPLNAIGGHVQLLEMGVHGPLNETQRHALGRVQRSQQHLLSLINDVLNFAKVEAGRIDYRLSDVSLADAVDEVAPMIEPQLSAKKLLYDVRVDRAFIARADREKMQQILLNLLSNAVKFTDAGGRITVDSVLPETADGDAPNLVHLRVKDTGSGIAPDKQSAIFEPFVQLHRSLSRVAEGTGLGLAISRDLARGMGGDLFVQSAEGEGSTFIISLPRAELP